VKKVLVGIGVLCVGFVLLLWMAKRYYDRQAATSQDRIEQQINKDLQDRKIAYVRKQYGDVTANEYEQCEKNPPGDEEHQLRCRKLVDRIESEINKLQ
jgi:flagellar biosynthesis/type III secretory pathway M-ring protein FliF/YscJ